MPNVTLRIPVPKVNPPFLRIKHHRGIQGIGVHYSGLPGTRGISSYYGDGGFPLPIAARLPRGVGVHYSGLPGTRGISAYTPGHLPPQSRGHFQNRTRRHFPRPADAVRRAQPVFGVLPEVSLPPTPGVSSYYGSGSFPLPIAARLPRGMGADAVTFDGRTITSGPIDLGIPSNSLTPAQEQAVIDSVLNPSPTATGLPAGNQFSIGIAAQQGADVGQPTVITDAAGNVIDPSAMTPAQVAAADNIPISAVLNPNAPPPAPFSFNNFLAGKTTIGSSAVSNTALVIGGSFLALVLFSGGKRR